MYISSPSTENETSNEPLAASAAAAFARLLEFTCEEEHEKRSLRAVSEAAAGEWAPVRGNRLFVGEWCFECKAAVIRIAGCVCGWTEEELRGRSEWLEFSLDTQSIY
jgi:hypothetical protein